MDIVIIIITIIFSKIIVYLSLCIRYINIYRNIYWKSSVTK